LPKLIRITTVPMSLHYLLRGQLEFMQQQGFEVLAVSADGPEREQIQALGIRHLVNPFTRKITPIKDLICLWQLIRLFKKIKPDIVHTHTPKAGLLGMLAARICGVPLRIHTVAGLPLMETTGFKRWLLMQTERITYACAHRVYPNSYGLLQFITKQWKVKSGKFKVIGKGSSNGIDTTFFSRSAMDEAQIKRIKLQYHLPEEAFIFCFIGRVVKDKGMRELIAAFKKLQVDHPTIYLLVVGPLEQELDPLNADDLHFLQNDRQVIMTGFQEDVRPWLMLSDVFVFPSYREGFPNVVMQAACMELPCIVTDINGCNEIIQHNESGLIVPVKDSSALYVAMQQLFSDETLRKTFAKKSREYVVANFEQQVLWQNLLEEYQG
jgi:glycosyltransferase involved in cell wall biosynthesis